MASSSAGQDGAGPEGLGADIASAPGGRALGVAQAGTASGHPLTPPPRQSVRPSPAPVGGPEEVAVCDLCGLVSRLPSPPVCPACGGGYG